MKPVLLAALALTLSFLPGCRTAAPPAPFDPLTLGPAGNTLKLYFDRLANPAPRATPLISHVKIEASLPGMTKQGVMEAEKTVAPNGYISYEMKSFTGDNIIKTKVIGLYLSAEQEASENQTPSINAINYRFKFKRRDQLGERTAMVYELLPVRKMIGLFKGELWLEEDTGIEMRQSGRLVKNPSVIFKTADFVRDYETKDGLTYLAAVDYQAETRVIGPVRMKMSLTRPMPPPETGTASAQSIP